MIKNTGFSRDELLDYAVSHDIINLDDVAKDMRESKLNETLKKVHKYKISQSKSDGRWRTYLPDKDAKNGRRQIAKSTKAALLNALYEFYQNQGAIIETAEKGMTLNDLYPMWLEYKSLETNRKSTITRIKAAWKKYYEGTEIIEVPIQDLDYITLREWALRIVGNDCKITKKEYYNFSIIMRQSLEYAYEKGYIDSNPYNRVKIRGKKFKRAIKKKAETEVFFEDEEFALKKYAWECYKNNRHYHQKLTPLAILFLFQTGLRIGEICALKYSDITDDGAAIIVSHMLLQGTGEIVDETKGEYGDREVVLTDEAKMIIEETVNVRENKENLSEQCIFSMNDKPLGYSSIKNVLYKYCEELDIPRKSPHKIRKTVSTTLRQVMPLESVKAMFGHIDDFTTDFHYTYDRMPISTKQQLMNSKLSANSPNYF